jgi:hypothetical protein
MLTSNLSQIRNKFSKFLFAKSQICKAYPGAYSNIRIIFQQRSDTMAYFNYHAKAKQLIADGHLTRFEIVDKWNNISPALVLYFDNNKPMPIREYRFDEYLSILQ